ncbi:claudin-1-like isoform X2 [Cheilinus undulatus]|uniref:claudin-1-like isoform X2 n=1 Tax=Cheilinus undulatus TaxID=241271 RepID=UPI001BD31690|nr:claudin-1-like isoform X2 [Cheilinus undulatus]
MAVGLQVVGLLLGVVSWCLQSSCTSSQVWKVRSQVESVTSSQWQFEGLWMSCAATSMGSIQCSRFKTVLGLPGVFTLIAVSWYAGRVIHDFYNPLYGGVRFELGTGLYLGWAASCLAVLGGSMLCCSYKKMPSTPPSRQFSYNFTTTSQGQSIYRAAPASDSSISKAYV